MFITEQCTFVAIFNSVLLTALCYLFICSVYFVYEVLCELVYYITSIIDVFLAFTVVSDLLRMNPFFIIF